MKFQDPMRSNWIYMKIIQLFIKKMYFKRYDKKVMTYIMQKKTRYKNPNTRYLNIILQGYKDCKLDEKYLNRVLKPSW